MKITKALAYKLIEESETFRAFVIDELFGSEKQSALVDKLIRAAYWATLDNDANSTPKILAIKTVKDVASSPENVFDMLKEFPDALIPQGDDGRHYCSLVWAKNFVEKYKDQIKYL